jgi:hypothetical protein
MFLAKDYSNHIPLEFSSESLSHNKTLLRSIRRGTTLIRIEQLEKEVTMKKNDEVKESKLNLKLKMKLNLR